MKRLVVLCIGLITFSAVFAQEVDTNMVKEHLEKIVLTKKPRNFRNIEVLNEVANYINLTFSKYSDSVWFQGFEYDSTEYKNVIASFGRQNKERIIIGAHYDVCGYQDGADDNASGVVGLLELARLLGETDSTLLKYRIDLVAYTLEEPPFFRSKLMGSYVHAEYLNSNNIPVKGMICLEMIGYFKDEKKTQDYPIGLLKLFYGSRGDYITVVQKTGSGRFVKDAKKSMKKQKLVKTKSFKAPKKMGGVDLSDHRNYWHFGYDALMVNNTAFYRNKNYHEKSDKLETLDIKRMSAVIQQVYNCLFDIR
ncbi:MAG: M28 family peptidase [Flavobacteriales bacterium]|nr:M28 family peptidase [Flavobacteriales bacterium]